MSADPSMSQLAEQVRTALETTDVEAFAHLLAPNVTWGAPGDPKPSCSSRKQVLTWYRMAREAGRPAVVVDVTPLESAILVATSTAPDPPLDPVADRWEVLAVTDGLVRDIRGYDDRDEALRAAAAV